MTVDCYYFLYGNIVCLCSDGEQKEVNQKEFEKWMKDNDKLQWQVNDEETGSYMMPITINDFWTAHDSYKKLMIADYLNECKPIEETTLFDLL